MKTLIAVAVAGGLLAPAMAVAQQNSPPSQLGNRWDGREHEPAPDTVRQREQAAGLRGTQDQQRARDDELNTLNRQILERARQGGQDGVMNGTAATAPSP